MSPPDLQDPCCIVGIGCRLPGNVRTPSQLWSILINNRTAQGVVPRDRFNIDAFYDMKGSRSGIMSANGGYFLDEDVRQFDGSFFGINTLESKSGTSDDPNDSAYMDPQQRKLLEVVFECFEDAGVTLSQMSGTNTGTYVGTFTIDHLIRQTRDVDAIHRYTATGCGTTILANRISHVFNLQGPSLSLDTACSSSVYCLHTAVNAIKNGDCEGAVVAGVNLITSPEQFLGTMKAGVLSPTSTCHTFDASANGYGRAEGVNVIYIKPLSAALRDNNRIWGVIRGTAVNANGATHGITLPNTALQEAVIRKAYLNARLSTFETDYVECHGTGTPVGDPIEVHAIGRAFSGRNGDPLLIGSVKANLGHSEAASGLTSVIKVALALRHGKIPPTFGVTRLNPELKLDDYHLKVASTVEEWPRALRRASVNSFGYGGANAHAIIESLESYMDADERRLQAASLSPDKTVVLPISAASELSLANRVKEIIDVLPLCDPASLESLSYTLTQRRSIFNFKKTILSKAGSVELVELDQHENHARFVKQLPSLSFVFTGQGSQYAGMARDLLSQNELFLGAIRQLDQALQTLPEGTVPSWTLEEVLSHDEMTITGAPSMFNKPLYSQSLCTAIQIAIVDLLTSWGVSATSVVGHSSGEIAAAYAAGHLSAAEAIRVAYLRGLAVERLEAPGAMLAAGIDVNTARTLIQENGLEAEVSIGCHNSPQSVTLTGSVLSVDSIARILNEAGMFARKLETGGRAYHSPMVKEVGALYEQMLRPVFDKRENDIPPSCKMYSTVGKFDDPRTSCVDNMDWPKYWRDNLEKPVQFSDAVTNLVTDAEKTFLVEIGPHSALKGPIKQITSHLRLSSQDVLYASTLVRGEDSNICMKRLAGILFNRGYSLDWQNVNEVKSQILFERCGPYPWDYSTGLQWNEPRVSVELRNRAHPRHELLGSRQLAGNGIDWAWRNVLHLDEVSWLRDHKIDSQVVFPAAAYIAMAIEALHQTQESDESSCSSAGFEFRDISIAKALVLPDGDDIGPDDQIELHTTVSARRLSASSQSASWYDFSISSWRKGHATTHCTGCIRTGDLRMFDDERSVKIEGNLEQLSTRGWYEKFKQERLIFGTQFQSVSVLKTHIDRMRTEAIGITANQPVIGSSARYSLHPITIDACLQTAIMSTAAGHVVDLRSFLPVFIAECKISNALLDAPGADAIIHARSFRTGFSNRRMECTMNDGKGNTILQLRGGKLSLYTGKLHSSPTSHETHLERHPCLRVRWKPDIQRTLIAGQYQLLSQYVQESARLRFQDLEDKNLAAIAVILDLAGHKNPEMHVLELRDNLPDTDGRDYIGDKMLGIVDGNTAFPRTKSWTTGRVDEEGRVSTLSGAPVNIDSFDVVVASQVSPAPPIRLGLQIRLSQQRLSWSSTMFLLWYTHDASPRVSSFADALALSLQKHLGTSGAKSLTLEDIFEAQLNENTTCVSLIELDRPFLAGMDSVRMDMLRCITNTVKNLLWVTTAGVMNSPLPDLTLCNGLSRAMMLEQPSLRFSVMDIGCSILEDSNWNTVFQNLASILTRSLDQETEFAISDNLLHISRFYPDHKTNSLLRRRLRWEAAPRLAPYSDVKPVKLSIDQVGVTDTIHFQQICEPPQSLPLDFVEVEVQSVGLNAKDVYTLNGRVETQRGTTTLEFAGIVTAVGADVQHLQVGDKTVVMAPISLGTRVQVPAWAAHRMLPHEDFDVLCSLPVAYATVLYALNDRARLQAGESILIHAGAGTVGIAAIAIARNIGARVFSTVSSSTKRQFLIDELHIPTEQIFYSRDTSFATEVLRATGGRGVDVVLNSVVGDLLHATWQCMSDFGRFVEIGKRDMEDAGRLDMKVFLRNTTFTAFDLSDMYYHDSQAHRGTLTRLIREVLQLYRDGKIEPPPLSKFDISNIIEAYRFFSKTDRLGKVVISLRQSEGLVPVVPSRYSAVLDPEKVYLLVGCLGGLGRSLSRWMAARGARKFVFLGRSGCDKPVAMDLVTSLRDSGASVKVVRGDVCQASAVVEAIQCCSTMGSRIGGIVQAAMGLHESLFATMTNNAWHTGIQPKVTGTWNIQSSLTEEQNRQMDFFLLMSSVSGTVGTATESNYCAANSFLDAFALWRRARGQPATSIGLGMISEVGYLHENPEIEALLLRRGLQPLNEEEFLQMADLAIAGSSTHGRSTATTDTLDTGEDSHILTGLETFQIHQLMEQGFDVDHGAMHDPRASILSATLKSRSGLLETDTDSAMPETGDRTAVSAWLMKLPKHVSAALKAQADAPSAKEAILRLIRIRFSNLLLTPLDQIYSSKPLSLYGVDSMIASEFRTWFWTTFKVDVPFIDLMSAEKGLDDLADLVEKQCVVV
ncbi:polyketide synthase [Xylariomycetidae sp. FL2044]|nr:polyketide synthase [Xylariomycetidae sp. FL2044]